MGLLYLEKGIMALDWRRARKPQQTEDAMGAGFVRNDGRVSVALKDTLAKRAEREEKRWLKTLKYQQRRSIQMLPRGK